MGRGVERLIVDRGGCCLGADAIDDDPYVWSRAADSKSYPGKSYFLGIKAHPIALTRICGFAEIMSGRGAL
jgi:hypothetical protein